MADSLRTLDTGALYEVLAQTVGVLMLRDGPRRVSEKLKRLSERLPEGLA